MTGVFGCWQLDDARVYGAAAVRCVFDGRLDNRRELVRALADHPSVDPECSDQQLVLAAYTKFGEAFPERLSGEFAAGICDHRSNRLLLARDRLGVRPLCYARVGATIIFGSSARALLAYPGLDAEPDDVTLADFILYFRSSDGPSRTFFRNVHAVPPAHLLVATPVGVTIRRYFDFDTARSIRLPTFRDYAAAFHELFVESVRRRVRSPRPVAVVVSGGLDSSYIFCVATRLVRHEPDLCPSVVGYNFSGDPGTPSDEREFVRALENGAGATIERVAQRSGFVDCAADDVDAAESPMMDALAGQSRAGMEAMRRADVGRVLTGHWGDQLLSDSDYLLDLVRSRQWRLLRQHAVGWNVGARRLAGRGVRYVAVHRLPAPLTAAARRARGGREAAWRAPWFTPPFRRLLRERAGHQPLPSVDGSWHAAAIYREGRRPYHLRCLEWNARIFAMHGMEVSFPYMDCDLIQFLMSIPGDMQSHGGVPRALMREAMRGVVPDAIVSRRDKGEFTHLANEGIARDFPLIREILTGSDALGVQLGYVDGDVLRSHMERWRSDVASAADAVVANRILDLCGLEFFLRAARRPVAAVAEWRQTPASAPTPYVEQ
jgi:asparagine synthase (glutamine-hydrolysing)